MQKMYDPVFDYNQISSQDQDRFFVLRGFGDMNAFPRALDPSQIHKSSSWRRDQAF